MSEKKYLFISNSNYPTSEIHNSTDKIALKNVRSIPINTAGKMNYKLYMGVNRIQPEKIETDCKYPIVLYNQNIFRDLFDIKNNIIAYKNLSRLLKQEQIDVIHCNTPIAGILGRILGEKHSVNKIIYTVHGFHFYKGGPKIKNFIFRTVEKFLAKKTDIIITINEEDYQEAQKFKLRDGGRVYKISGVGVDTKVKRSFTSRETKRKEMGFDNDDCIIMSSGNLVKGKNFKTLIKSISATNNKNIKLIICGRGKEKKELETLITKLSLEKQVYLLGFRDDIDELLKMSDIFAFTSLREGLPRALMEAMSAGLPCIISDIRGNRDLYNSGGSFLVNALDYKEIAKKIQLLCKDEQKRNKMGVVNKEYIKNFDSQVVSDQYARIFKENL